MIPVIICTLSGVLFPPCENSKGIEQAENSFQEIGFGRKRVFVRKSEKRYPATADVSRGKVAGKLRYHQGIRLRPAGCAVTKWTFIKAKYDETGRNAAERILGYGTGVSYLHNMRFLYYTI